jgi:competence protein ComFB
MEDVILKLIDEYYEEARKKGVSFCGCSRCRLDLACFALNRSEPQYIVSERGLFHSQADYQSNIQKLADLSALVRDGFGQIQKLKRHEAESPDPGRVNTGGPHFNFPVIAGRLLLGSTFESIKAAHVILKIENELCPMISGAWNNPYEMKEATAGQYFFSPSPVKAGSSGEKRDFSFSITASAQGMESVEHHFTLPLVSDDSIEEHAVSSRMHKISDLYFFPNGGA